MRRNRDRENVAAGLGAVFGSAETDLLGGIIQTDRRRAGRTEASAPETEPAGKPVSKLTSQQVSQPASGLADKVADQVTSEQVSLPDDLPVSRQADGSDDSRAVRRSEPKSGRSRTLAKRHADADALTKTDSMTVSVRLPRAFNEYLDEYVHKSWPNRVLKQELVIEALKLLFARRGRGGEEVLTTDLLPEEK